MVVAAAAVVVLVLCRGGVGDGGGSGLGMVWMVRGPVDATVQSFPPPPAFCLPSCALAPVPWPPPSVGRHVTVNHWASAGGGTQAMQTGCVNSL